ncbi:MAG: MgtC/SapB family protein [Gammaproteobacteria bacterium]
MTGTATAMIAQQAASPWLLPVVAAGLVAMMISADHHRGDADEAPDTTTTVALLLCFLLGAMLWHGHRQLAVALALGATALLYFKAELHGITQRLTRQDIVSFLQFALITFVVLPVLPDRGYGPYGALNPYTIWLMVVLTSGLSLAGYAALRLTPQSGAVPLLGLLGGMVSSTATTLVFSRQVREDPAHANNAAVIIAIANLVVLLRIAVLAGVVAPAGLPVLAPVLGAGLLAGMALPLRHWLALHGSREPAPELDNPAGLRQALMFGAIFALVLVVSAAFHERAGSMGVYAVAAVSGLADMDAIALSTFNLLAGSQLTAAEATVAIVIALVSNMAFKATLVLTVAGRAIAAKVALSFLAQVAGLAAGALVFAA